MRALILDDELNSAESLLLLLRKYCAEIGVVGLETDPVTALGKALEEKPELLFLDIDLQSTNAFEWVTQLDYPFGVIFTTAHEKYAVKAFKYDAIEYLLKPIDSSELLLAVEKAKKKLVPIKRLSGVRPDPPVFLQRITIPTANGLKFLALASVIRFEGDGSYTRAILENKTVMVISSNLGAIEKMTLNGGFFRTHKSHLVNALHVHTYVPGEGGEVLLSHEERAPVSRDRRAAFLKFMHRYGGGN